MTLACLRIMKMGLRFNICNIETSYFSNVDLDLPLSIGEPPLEYACVFWGNHLQATIIEVELRSAVRDFLFTRLLYWLEALSVLDMIKIASQTLILICKWSIVSCKDPPFARTNTIIADRRSRHFGFCNGCMQVCGSLCRRHRVQCSPPLSISPSICAATVSCLQTFLTTISANTLNQYWQSS